LFIVCLWRLRVTNVFDEAKCYKLKTIIDSEMSGNSNRISIDDTERDQGTIRDKLMDELCKRQREAEGRGDTTDFNITDVWQSSFPTYTIRNYIDQFIERYQTYSDYFELLPNDTTHLAERGRRYCRDLERQ
jgi:hypothetical protein